MNNFEDQVKELNMYMQNGDIENATELFEKVIGEAIIHKDNKLPFWYYEYAMYLFELENYSLSLKFNILAYNMNYKQEEILQHIYSCYVTPNEEEFKETYTLQAKNIVYGSNMPLYEETEIDFIPLEEDVYFVYDKVCKTFEGIFDLTYFKNDHETELKVPDEFSDFSILFQWNWNEIRDYLYSAKKRKCYLLAENHKKACAFLKIPKILETFSITLFDSENSYQRFFHQNTSVYIPRILYGYENDLSRKIKQIMTEEHEYRISPQGRDTSNVLLSICIPSWDRGHRALQRIRNLLKSPLDAEIEFVLSNNGSTYFVEQYHEIRDISDARLTYFEFDTNHGLVANWLKVSELAKGRFFLLLSDEDDIILDNLYHYLNLLKTYPTLGILRSGTVNNYCFLKDVYVHGGMGAFKEFFLADNYVSGIIRNTKYFNEMRFDKMDEIYKDNASYQCYPHMWWDAFMVLKYDLCKDHVYLCYENESELDNQNKRYQEDGVEMIELLIDDMNGLPHYALYEARLQQHDGFIELINALEFETKEDLRVAYQILCNKTAFLVDLVKETYIQKGEDWDAIIEKVVNYCMEGINKLKIN